MTPVTLADIKEQVRTYLGDDNIEDEVITDAANEFVNGLFADTRTRLMQTSTTLAGVQGAYEIALPTDYQAWESIQLVTPQSMPLTDYREYGDFMKLYGNFSVAAQQQGYTYTQYGNKLRFSAPLNAAHSIYIDYIRKPVEMVDDTDVCEIPGTYRKLIRVGTMTTIMKSNEDYAEAFQELDDIEPLITTFKRNEAPGQGKTGPVIMRTNRRGGNQSSRWDF